MIGGPGIAVAVDPSGAYSVTAAGMGWTFSGNIGSNLSNLGVAGGTDAAGAYTEIAFDFISDAARHASIRSYVNKPAVLFSFSCPDGAPNTFSFPAWNSYPKSVRLLTYTGTFATPTFETGSADSPWVFFDAANRSFILSPASNFMAATTTRVSGTLSSGIHSQIQTLPKGFQHETLLVVESGINQAFETWGNTLTALHGKTRPANDADLTLNKLGYWTDHGAAYWYNTAAGMSYEETLRAVKAEFDQKGLAAGYLQLDSWFYPKGAADQWDSTGGIYEYLASPTLFPEGLDSFQRSLGLPLVSHARWIDSASPYRQTYAMSNNVVIDPTYWTMVASYLKRSGVVTYEQDWLDQNALPALNLTDGAAFLGNMRDAMAQQGLTMQYSMPLPRHLLFGSNFSNLTTSRLSNDRFDSTRWTPFIYASRFAQAMGVWPFADVFMSSETNNLLVANLSAGPIGVGDPVGSLDAASLLRAVRADGTIVKPDVPLTPIDSSYAKSLAAGEPVQVASTWSDFSGLRTHYLFAWRTGAGSNATFSLDELGISGTAYLYDYFAGRGRIVRSGRMLNEAVAADSAYWVVAPVGPSGMAMIGDAGQFVTMGKKRIANYSDDGTVAMDVLFAAGEGARTIVGHSAMRPVATAVQGTATLSWNAKTGLFRVVVASGDEGTASIRIVPDGSGSPR